MFPPTALPASGSMGIISAFVCCQTSAPRVLLDYQQQRKDKSFYLYSE